MKITSFENGNNVDFVRHEIDAALAKLGEQLGLDIKLAGSARYAPDGQTFTVNGLAIGVKNESPYMKDVNPVMVQELNKFPDTRGKLLHVFEYGKMKCVIVGRKNAKIWFKPLGDPAHQIQAWRTKLTDYDAQGDILRKAIAEAKPM